MLARTLCPKRYCGATMAFMIRQRRSKTLWLHTPHVIKTNWFVRSRFAWYIWNVYAGTRSSVWFSKKAPLSQAGNKRGASSPRLTRPLATRLGTHRSWRRCCTKQHWCMHLTISERCGSFSSRWSRGDGQHLSSTRPLWKRSVSWSTFAQPRSRILSQCIQRICSKPIECDLSNIWTGHCQSVSSFDSRWRTSSGPIFRRRDCCGIRRRGKAPRFSFRAVPSVSMGGQSVHLFKIQ